MEEEVLTRWEETEAFEKSVQQSLDEGRPEYNFYDGPPFATGLPHYGHLLAGTIKDVVTRYAHLDGFHVSRRFGWDTHGLPVEFEIDKKLGIKSSQDVADMGIRKYNAECRSIVTRYCKEWETTVKRMGRWIDFKNDYKTLEPWYMESVWWVFKTIFEKDLIFKGFKVMPYSYGCTTPLSNFEATSNYKTVTDPAVIVAFPLIDEPEVSLVAWTTTPWTLPSNLALCVHPEFIYVQIKDIASGKQYILGEGRLAELYPKMKKQKDKYKVGSEYEIVKKFTGAELKGKRYEPIFPYFASHENAFQVVNGTYVTDDSGTGVVHQSPAFGEDDYNVCMAAGVIVAGGALPCPVNADGQFTDEVSDFAGRNVKEADNDICAAIKAKGRLVSKNSIEHSYPFCWRSNTPLIYKAVPSWFLKLEPIKDQLLANNEKTYWVPSNVKEKRFHNWLRDARDWNISRNRYWGTPIPIWASEDGEELVVIGSIEELEKLSGQKVTDLHRENIDDIEIPSQKGKGVLRRIPEVFDCWFESGSMPYAQVHYPFENKERFEKNFPADFIAEGIDQTRGWFYTLMVLATALFDKPAFKNLIVNGLILAADGKKMSKSLRNYPDPMNVVNSYGADALRLYLINSPVVRAESLKFNEEGVLQNLKEIFIPWFNAYRFFVQNALRCENDAQWAFDRSTSKTKAASSDNIMDRWIMAALHGLIRFVRKEMEAYRLYTVVPRLVKFIGDLCNIYVRFNRKRLKGDSVPLEDTQAALSVLYCVLVDLAKLMAPFTPFFAEYQYRKLVRPQTDREDSVHFMRNPTFDESLINSDIEDTMANMQEVITLGRLARGNDLPVKRPLREVIIVHEDQGVLDNIKTLESYIKVELNVHNVSYSTEEEKYCTLSAKLNGSAEDENGVKLGRRLGKKMGAVNAAMRKLTHKEVSDFQTAGKITLEEVEIPLSDVFVNRTVTVDETKFRAQCSLMNITVVLDTYVDKVLLGEQTAREITNRVQKLRKSSRVQIGDALDVFYKVTSTNPEIIAEVDEAVKANAELINSTIRSKIEPASKRPAHAQVIGKVADTLNEEGTTLELMLCEPSVAVLPEEQLAKALSVESKMAKGIAATLGSMDFTWIKSNASKALEVTIDGKLFNLECGKHYFLSASDMPSLA